MHECDALAPAQHASSIPSPPPPSQMCVAGSLDGRYVATVSRDQFRHVTSLLLFHGGTLEPYMRIETDVQAFTRSVGKAWEDDLDLGLGFRVRIFGAKPLRRAKWAAMTASEWPCPALPCPDLITAHPTQASAPYGAPPKRCLHPPSSQSRVRQRRA